MRELGDEMQYLYSKSAILVQSTSTWNKFVCSQYSLVCAGRKSSLFVIRTA